MVNAGDGADGESGGEECPLSIESPLLFNYDRIGFSRIIFRRAVFLT